MGSEETNIRDYECLLELVDNIDLPHVPSQNNIFIASSCNYYIKINVTITIDRWRAKPVMATLVFQSELSLLQASAKYFKYSHRYSNAVFNDTVTLLLKKIYTCFKIIPRKNIIQ